MKETPHTEAENKSKVHVLHENKISAVINHLPIAQSSPKSVGMNNNKWSGPQMSLPFILTVPENVQPQWGLPDE